MRHCCEMMIREEVAWWVVSSPEIFLHSGGIFLYSQRTIHTWGWTIGDIWRCLNIQDRSGDMMLCRHDSLCFQSYIYYQHSGSQIMCVTDTDDILCACVYMGLHPPAGYQRCGGKVEGLDQRAHGNRRCQRTLDSIPSDIECLLDGVTNDNQQYMNNDLITTCYHAPPEWIPLMRRIAVTAEYVRATAQGDVSMKEEEDSSVLMYL